MGASLDWSREAYTLDDQRNFAVRTAFKRMYDDDLIFRKDRVVNWDPKGQTTISDDEVIHEERKALLYTFKYTQNISTAERTGAVVEPLPKLQWFVDVEKKFKIPKSSIQGIKSGSETSLKELMRTVVKNGQIKILPKRFEKEYFRWIDNLRPWCISRQIWFGHRIPVWYHEPKCIS